jgi:hypothetical protein
VVLLEEHPSHDSGLTPPAIVELVLILRQNDGLTISIDDALKLSPKRRSRRCGGSLAPGGGGRGFGRGGLASAGKAERSQPAEDETGNVAAHGEISWDRRRASFPF